MADKPEKVVQGTIEMYCARVDAGFLARAQKCGQVIAELVSNFTIDQLKDWAKRLPLDKEVGKLVLRSEAYPSANQKFDERILAARLKRCNNHYLVAAYIAFVCDGLAVKMLTEIDALLDAKLKLVEELKTILLEAGTGKTPLLARCIRDGAGNRIMALIEKEQEG
jgi:hypothetical protein